MRAGDRAVSRSAYKEAAAHFSAGLRLADALSVPADRTRRQLDFLLKLGPALMVTRGLQSAEADNVFGRAADRRKAQRLHGTVQGEVEFVAQRQYQAQDGFGARPGARAGEPVQRSGDGELLLEA